MSAATTLSYGGRYRKLMTRKLAHGDTFRVEHQHANQTVFSVNFEVDFDTGGQSTSGVSVSAVYKIFLLRSKHHIQLRSPYHRDSVELIRQADRTFRLRIHHSTYGVYLNGRLVSDGLSSSNGFLPFRFLFYIKDLFLWPNGGTAWSERAGSGRCAWTKWIPDVCAQYAFKLFWMMEIEVLDPPDQRQRNSNLFVRMLPP